jgi:death-on-curing protein
MTNFGEIWRPIPVDVLALLEGMMRARGENPAPVMADGSGRLESALAAPEWAALHSDADLAEQAALYAVRIAQAHALADGNKRLGYIVSVVFLRENGHPLPAEETLSFAKRIEAALEHSMTIGEIATWLRSVIGVA